jgi:hypothetical protein
MGAWFSYVVERRTRASTDRVYAQLDSRPRHGRSVWKTRSHAAEIAAAEQARDILASRTVSAVSRPADMQAYCVAPLDVMVG